MLTVTITTQRTPSGSERSETFQAVHRDDGWYVRREPNLQWSRTPIAPSDADRSEVSDRIKEEYGADD